MSSAEAASCYDGAYSFIAHSRVYGAGRVETSLVANHAIFDTFHRILLIRLTVLVRTGLA